MKIQVDIVSAFIDGDTGGNAAGVVLDADALTSEQKFIIASKVGLSETAFVSESNSADFKLDFFTPTRQIPHCGHATIATFNHLSQIGLVKEGKSSKETIDGDRNIVLEDGATYMEQVSPRYTDLNDKQSEIYDSLGITDKDICVGCAPTIVNTGNSFLIVALKDEATVKGLRPDFDKIKAISDQYDLIGYYVFSLGSVKAGRDAGARMFAPGYGINEESATGMAAGPLGCYLYDHMNQHQDRFDIEQGHLMSPPSPSVITVKLKIENGKIKGLLAGGRTKALRSFALDI